MTYLEYWNEPSFLLSPLAIVGLILFASIFLSGSDFGVFKVPTFPKAKRILASLAGAVLISFLFFASQKTDDVMSGCQGEWINEESFYQCTQIASNQGYFAFHVLGRKTSGDDEWKAQWVKRQIPDLCWWSVSGQNSQNQAEISNSAAEAGFELIWENHFDSYWRNGLSFQSLWLKKSPCD